MYKKILIGVGSILGTAGIMVGGVSLISNNQKIANLFKYPWGSVYEETQYKLNNQNAILQMYTNRINELNEQILNLKANLSKVESERDANQNKIKALTAEKESLVSQVDVLTKEKMINLSEIERLNAEMSEINSKLSVSEEKVEELQKEKSELQSEIDALILSNSDKQATIDELNEDIELLTSDLSVANATIGSKNDLIASLESDLLLSQNEVTRLTGLIESYNEMADISYEVVFYVGDVLVSSCAVRNGGTVLSSKIPQSSESYKILGWEKEDGTIVSNISSLTITEDLVLYAVYENIYNVSFYDGDTLLSSGNYAKSDLVLPEVAVKDGYEFLGWISSVDGKTYCSIDEITLTEDVTFYAQFVKYTDYLTDPNTDQVYAIIIDDQGLSTTILQGCDINGVATSENTRINIGGMLGFSCTLVDSSGNSCNTATRFDDDFYVRFNEVFVLDGYEFMLEPDSFTMYDSMKGEDVEITTVNLVCVNGYSVSTFGGAFELQLVDYYYDIDI